MQVYRKDLLLKYTSLAYRYFLDLKKNEYLYLQFICIGLK
jgi:hypothetical protein